jgi:hypothetical protein
MKCRKSTKNFFIFIKNFSALKILKLFKLIKYFEGFLVKIFQHCKNLPCLKYFARKLNNKSILKGCPAHVIALLKRVAVY